MEKTDFEKGMRELTEFYDKEITTKALFVWWEKLRWLDSRDLWGAVEDITSNEKQMPTPGVFLKYADEARARRSAKEKSQEQDTARGFFDPRNHNSELAKESVEFVQTLMKFGPRLVEKAQFEIDWTQRMAKKYPHLASQYREHENDARKRLIVAEAMEEVRRKRTEVKSEGETQCPGAQQVR